MKVSTAMICLDCDELFDGDSCPRCLNSKSVPLRIYFQPIINFNTIKEAVEEAKKKAKLKKKGEAPVAAVSDPRHIIPFFGVKEVFGSFCARCVAIWAVVLVARKGLLDICLRIRQEQQAEKEMTKVLSKTQTQEARR